MNPDRKIFFWQRTRRVDNPFPVSPNSLSETTAVLIADLDVEMQIIAKENPLLAKYIKSMATIFENNEGEPHKHAFLQGATLAYRALAQEAKLKGGKLPKLSRRVWAIRATDVMNVEENRDVSEKLRDAIDATGNAKPFLMANPTATENLMRGLARSMATTLKSEPAMTEFLEMYEQLDDMASFYMWLGIGEVFTLFKKNIELKQLKAIPNFPKI